MQRSGSRTLALLLIPTLFLAGCGSDEPGADLVLLNGKIVTVDSALGEVEALAIQGDRIVAVGTSEEIESRIGAATEVIDLAGRLAIPGFIEGHGHFIGFGESRMILDLSEVDSWEGLVAMVGAAAAEAAPGSWITGRGWHQEKWVPAPPETFDGVPSHHGLSAVSPDNPVLLTHASGHASFANARAMELAGITRDTPDPEGGTLIRDASGEPTGFLRQAAQGLVRSALASSEAELSEADHQARFERQVEVAGVEALRHGVTSFHDAGSNFATIDRLRGLAEAGRLPIRLHVMVRGESNEEMDRHLSEYRIQRTGNSFLTVRAIKRQIDGALGTHGAWLLDPYYDLPGTSGLPQVTPENLRETAEIAIRHGFQFNTHAIGDRGNQVSLDIYESVFAAHPDRSDLRWRIEHAQNLHPDDVARFAELGVIASMQGIHATSDGPWVPQRLGEERTLERGYVWRALIDAGATICNGTDVPVEPISPISSYYASVSRMMRTGERLSPEQAMTRMEALESYTLNCAYAGFEEDILGSLTPGKLADIVVLDRDILTIEEDQIPGTLVDLTIVGGEVRFRR